MPMMLPISAHRFRVSNCPSQITQNTVDVTIDFVEETVAITTRLTVEPESFRHAQQFARTHRFTVDFMDGGKDGAFYGLDFAGVELIEHELKLDYANGGWAPCNFTFKYRDIGILVPQKDEDDGMLRTEGFLTPSEAVEKLANQKSDVSEDEETYTRDAGC